MTTALDSTGPDVPGQTTIDDVVEEGYDAKARQSASNKAYGRATAKLRTAHRAEFNELLEKEFAEAGLTYRKRASAEERAIREAEAKKAKAAEKLAAILSEFPDLAVTPVTQ